ncbi:MAG: hypothetical protein JNL11_16120 [Bdellovibrionaceae bacterium]|nr:hypothetical protein [Pseudobdellovibrionaceae bacterium]
MNQMIFFMMIIFVSTFALSADNHSRIKCSILGAEDKVYYFNIQTKRYRLSVHEKGHPKTSLSRQIQQQTNSSVEATSKVSYSFQIDDRTQVNVDMDKDSRRGTGEIKLRSKGHTKKFDGCEYLTASSDSMI